MQKKVGHKSLEVCRRHVDLRGTDSDKASGFFCFLFLLETRRARNVAFRSCHWHDMLTSYRACSGKCHTLRVCVSETLRNKTKPVTDRSRQRGKVTVHHVRCQFTIKKTAFFQSLDLSYGVCLSHPERGKALFSQVIRTAITETNRRMTFHDCYHSK